MININEIWSEQLPVTTTWSDQKEQMIDGSMIGFIISSNTIWEDKIKSNTVWTNK